MDHELELGKTTKTQTPITISMDERKQGTYSDFGKAFGNWFLVTLGFGVGAVLITTGYLLIAKKTADDLPPWYIWVATGLVLILGWNFSKANLMGDALDTIWNELKFGFWMLSMYTLLPIAVGVAIIVIPVIALFLWGLFTKKDGFYYLTYQPTLFDADDIAATSFTVHKSILRVLDKEGIDISKLRIKEKFTGGRKGEDI